MITWTQEQPSSLKFDGVSNDPTPVNYTATLTKASNNVVTLQLNQGSNNLGSATLPGLGYGDAKDLFTALANLLT